MFSSYALLAPATWHDKSATAITVRPSHFEDRCTILHMATGETQPELLPIQLMKQANEDFVPSFLDTAFQASTL